MNTPRNSLTVCIAGALASALLFATVVPDAQAQSKREKMEAIRAKQRGEAPDKAVQAETLYPKATREQPDARPTRSGAKALKDVQQAFEAGDYARTIALAGEVAADEDANAYDKSFAWLFAGNAASSNGDDAMAAKFFQNALAANGLDNDNHYTVMFNLAAVQYGLDQYQQALDVIDRYIAETGTDKVEARTLRGGLLIALERYDEAARLYEEQLAAHPDDKNVMMNAVAAYQQAGQDDKAMALLGDAHARGMFSTPNEYRALYVSYINSDRDAEALAVIEEGLAKGVIQQDAQLARDYMVLGQKAYYDGDDARAIEMYQRAAPIADNGEAALNLAKIYSDAGRKAEAAAAARQALDKGVREPEQARTLLGGE